MTVRRFIVETHEHVAGTYVVDAEDAESARAIFEVGIETIHSEMRQETIGLEYYQAFACEVQEVRELPTQADQDDDVYDPSDGKERYGAGVCMTGQCVEPCGEYGGCAR